MIKRLDIFVADPSMIIRGGVVSVLSRLSDFIVNIAEIEDLSTLANELKEVKPDILIVNPSYLGLVTPDQLRSDSNCPDMIIIALQSGVVLNTVLNSYDATISINDTLDSIQSLMCKIVSRNTTDKESKRELTQRERDVVICIVKGMSNRQIAETLYLSPHTVITHRRNITNKLQISSAAGLTIYAIVNKLVDIADIKSV